MLVYRVADKIEMRCIFSDRELNNIGNYFQDNFLLSTHNYKEDERYMHFFKEIISLLYIKHEYMYLCVYNIDDFLLENYMGIGFYDDVFFYSGTVKKDEYAIPSRLISFDSLVRVDYISHDINLEDYEEDIKRALVLKYRRR